MYCIVCTIENGKFGVYKNVCVYFSGGLWGFVFVLCTRLSFSTICIFGLYICMFLGFVVFVYAMFCCFIALLYTIVQ